MSRSNSRK